METRIITQVKVYKLMLNPMAANHEKHNIVAISYDHQKLLAWYESLKVEQYKEGRFLKTFQKGSVLEPYNPIDWTSEGGIYDEWTQEEDITEYINHAKASYGFIQVPELIV